MSSYYQRHIFFCLNQRDNGQSSCGDFQAQAGFDAASRPTGFPQEGLADEIVHPDRQAPLAILGKGIGGQGDDRHAQAFFARPYPPRGLQTVEPGHLQSIRIRS